MRLALLSLILCCSMSSAQQEFKKRFLDDTTVSQNGDANEDDDKDNSILDGADTDSKTAVKGDTTNGGVDNSMPTTDELKKIKSQMQKTNVPKDNLNDWEIEDLKTRYEKGTYRLTLNSITPRGGPLYGTTRVTVRAENIGALVDAYPNPKCRFGTNSLIVDAAYIKCTKNPGGFYDKEKGANAAEKVRIYFVDFDHFIERNMCSM